MLEETTAGPSARGASDGGGEGGEARSAAALDEVAKKITSYEDAFRKIKEATGLTDVNEVIQKFMTQEETSNNLKHLTRETQAKIDALNEETAAAKVSCHVALAGPCNRLLFPASPGNGSIENNQARDDSAVNCRTLETVRTAAGSLLTADGFECAHTFCFPRMLAFGEPNSQTSPFTSPSLSPFHRSRQR